LLQEL
jgi:hypothetical protein